jgi:hypothetical protein
MPAPPTGGLTTASANLRSEPRIAPETVVGTLCAGDTLEYINIQTATDGVRWYQVRVAQIGATCSPRRVPAGTVGWAAASVISAPSGDVARYVQLAGLELPTAISLPTSPPTARPAAQPTARPQPKPTAVTIAPGTYRVGAICRDGTHSNATGRGACSHHGGVDHWLYNS